MFEAAATAVEAVDLCVGKVIDAVRRSAGSAIITADHGNAEEMAGVRDGKLADIAPTMLGLLGLPKPPGMTGESVVL
ncbi:MAG: hypothetical protein EF813_11165 [Methanosarcinales archaeon]|nr:MAG: hypothetical protein EF813_11165 [Methanosarcinales archaeon]